MLATAYHHSIALLRDDYRALGDGQTTLINPLILPDGTDTFVALGQKCKLQVEAELKLAMATNHALARNNACNQVASVNGGTPAAAGASGSMMSTGVVPSSFNVQMDALDSALEDALARFTEVCPTPRAAHVTPARCPRDARV